MEYHKNIGFDKFILVDNNIPNSKKFSDVIQDYIDDGLVEIEDKKGQLIVKEKLFKIYTKKIKTDVNG